MFSKMCDLNPLKLRGISRKDFLQVQQATVACKYCVLNDRSSEITQICLLKVQDRLKILITAAFIFR